MIGKRSAAETLSEILSVNIEALEKYPDELAAPITHSIGLLITAVKGIDAAALEGASALVVLAWDAAWKAGSAWAVMQNKQPLLTGIATVEGGKRGEEDQHGTPAERAKKRTRAKELYDLHWAKLQPISREDISKVVSKELSEEGIHVKPRTVLQWVPNPTPSQRGRPRKK
jgi:hypothetical protein